MEWQYLDLFSGLSSTNQITMAKNKDIFFDNTVVELRIYICCTEQQIELLSSLFAIPTFLAGFAHTNNLYIFK